MLDKRQMIIITCAIIAGIVLFGILKYFDGKDIRSDDVAIQDVRSYGIESEGSGGRSLYLSGRAGGSGGLLYGSGGSGGSGGNGDHE